MSRPEIRPRSIEERKVRKALGELTADVRVFADYVDSLFSQSLEGQARVDRGRKLADAIEALRMSNDKALCYGLGFDFRKLDRLDRKKIMREARRMFEETRHG